MRTFARGDVVRVRGRVGVVWHVDAAQIRYLPILTGRRPAHRADIGLDAAATALVPELKSPAVRCADPFGSAAKDASLTGHVSGALLAYLLAAVAREAAIRAAENGLHYALRGLTGATAAA